ncbi:MAG: branched chain amino acid aminotransferase, partial [Paludibacteraceae bacterium]|nr:branched chain amino acid aminotransferase [Paludibacteraceae bacterium]
SYQHLDRIDDPDAGKSYVIAKNGTPGPISEKLYKTIRGIQYGEIEDKHGWVMILD